MKALLYLLRKTIQNALKELVKKPVALIPYLVIAGLLIFSATMTSGEPAGEVRNLNAYAAIVNGVFLLHLASAGAEAGDGALFHG